jgi:hypothetical protein
VQSIGFNAKLVHRKLSHISLLMQQYLYIEENMFICCIVFHIFVLLVCKIRECCMLGFLVYIYYILYYLKISSLMMSLNFLTIMCCFDILYREKSLTSMVEWQRLIIFVAKRTSNRSFFCLLSKLDVTTKAYFLGPSEIIKLFLHISHVFFISACIG